MVDEMKSREFRGISAGLILRYGIVVTAMGLLIYGLVFSFRNIERSDSSEAKSALVESKGLQMARESLDKSTRAVLSASVRAALPTATGGQEPQISAFKSSSEEVEWLSSMSRRLDTRFLDHESRIALLKSVHYEATRAGLDPQLILGMIEVLSNFDKSKTDKDGRLGFMQVYPGWVELIGARDDNLLDLRTNLRYGCVILRHYLDFELGNLFRALIRYDKQLAGDSANDGKLDDSTFARQVDRRWKSQWK